MRRLIEWVAGLFGLTVLADADVVAARLKAQLLLQYAQRSGALNHPKRIKARARLIASSAAILENLGGAE